MNLKITIRNVDMDKVTKLAEESENNESTFIKKLCRDLLIEIGKGTQSMSNEAKSINKVNPYGFPSI